MEITFNGKIALITGGSRGIGKSTALAMAQAGATVVLVGRKLEDLEKTAEEIKAAGGKAFPISAHAGRMEDITSMVNTVKEKFGRIDILVNNAATNPTMDAAIDASERAWDSIMNLNLRGLFFLSQAVARIMREQRSGAIVNISSTAGLRPNILPVYSISKAGVNMITKVMAKEMAPFGIRVNTVSPGEVKTKFSEALWGNPDIHKFILDHTPMRRMAEPEEIADAIIFLASDKAGFITGHNLVVDGGASI